MSAMQRRTYESEITPGMCDINGHMNVVYYTQFFDAATWKLLSFLTGDPPLANDGLSWADVRHHIEFLREVRAGETIHVLSQVNRVGSKSLTLKHALTVADERRPRATCEVVTVRFDLQARQAVSLPRTLKDRARETLAAGAG